MPRLEEGHQNAKPVRSRIRSILRARLGAADKHGAALDQTCGRLRRQATRGAC
jgi:hypothetical protein